MENFHLLDTATLVKILSEYTTEYNKKIKAGAEALIAALTIKIKFLRNLIELRNHNTDICQSSLGIDDLTTSKN